MQFIWPIFVVIAANVVYNICAKQTPASIDPFASLSIMYLIAMILSIVMFFLTSPQKNYYAEMSKANWTSFAFAASILALEFGYVNIYRVGWKISTASLVANIGLAIILLLVGFLCYKESISARQIIGMIICAAGLLIISE